MRCMVEARELLERQEASGGFMLSQSFQETAQVSFVALSRDESAV